MTTHDCLIKKHKKKGHVMYFWVQCPRKEQALRESEKHTSSSQTVHSHSLVNSLEYRAQLSYTDKATKSLVFQDATYKVWSYSYSRLLIIECVPQSLYPEELSSFFCHMETQQNVSCLLSGRGPWLECCYLQAGLLELLSDSCLNQLRKILHGGNLNRDFICQQSEEWRR